MIKSSPCEATWEKNGKELFGCCVLMQVGCAPGIAGQMHDTAMSKVWNSRCNVWCQGFGIRPEIRTEFIRILYMGGTSMTRIFSQCTHCCPLSEDVQHCSAQDVLEAVSLFKLHGQLSGLVIWNSFVASGGADHAAELHKEMLPSAGTVSAVSIGMGKLEPVG